MSFSREPRDRRITNGVAPALAFAMALILTMTGQPRAYAGKLSWLDDVVQEVILEAKAGSKGAVRTVGGDGARTELRARAACS